MKMPTELLVDGHRYVLAEPEPLAKPSEFFYTKEERQGMLRRMAEIADAFYWSAFVARVHSFIEFAGLMNEFIKLCSEAEVQDIDWTQSNVHSQAATLPMQTWHAQYLGEKFGCIFAGTFARKPELMKIFLAAMENKPVAAADPTDTEGTQ